ncbi:hypothetical protein FPOAC2_02239 [Fusarium poae]|uniref:hypothetical protein n=1 Tax=Fusarium poae TaxID=36050 RepID=UPI001CE8529C|nr:hypothetical protein FPOAC1_002151 [Fusarium poae]KAG8676153.1 hypothetical protein FPOAC1_002151 [Fusarium poae]
MIQKQKALEMLEMASERSDLNVSPEECSQQSLTPSSMAAGPQLIGATYLMTRERAMAHAGDIVKNLGHRGFDQASLVPQMNEWLSLPVIKVLSEEMKNRVSIWCQQHGREWLDAIRDADEDIMEYQYTSTLEEPVTTIPTIQSSVEEKLHEWMQEILHEQRESTAKIMARIDGLQHLDQTSPAAPPTKRRRANTRGPSKNVSMDNLQKIDEGLCHLLGDDSELVHCFREYAVNADPNFSDARSKPNEKAFWSKGQLENFRKEARELGLGILEYKLLDRTCQEMDEGGLSMENIAVLSRQLASREQYENLEAKFPFPVVCDKE